MARSFRRVIGGRTRSVRENTWGSLEITQVAIAANTKVLVGSLNAAALALRPFTIVRTHLTQLWVSDQTAAAEVALGAMGFIVATEQAIAAGVASLPDPITEADSPWFLWQGMQSFFQFVTAAGFETQAGREYQTDSKAMRKVGTNEDIAMVVANLDANDGCTYQGVGRFLMKLH